MRLGLVGRAWMRGGLHWCGDECGVWDDYGASVDVSVWEESEQVGSDLVWCWCSLPFARGPGSERGRGGSGAFRGRGGGRSAGSAGGRGSGGRGRGAPAVEKTVEDLDAELESYHAEAMQTN